MIVLQLKGVSKAFGVDVILRDVSLTLPEGGRMGLVGVNGSGKSTLFHLICGQMEPDEGEIAIARGTSIGLLRQQADILGNNTVYDELARVFEPLRKMEERLRATEREMADSHEDAARLSSLSEEYARLTARFESAGGYEWPSRIQGVLSGLGLQDRQDQLANVLSGGEQTRLCLARLLLTEPDLLLLDEPTNHLDLAAVSWLEETLKKYKGTVLVISHDRYFMNAVCDSVAELRGTRLSQYAGNYDEFVRRRAENLERQMKEYSLQQAEIARQQEIIARYRMYNREKSIRAAESREKRLAKLERVDRPTEEKKVRFAFSARRRTGDEVLSVRGLAKSFEGRSLFQNFSMDLRAGDRVAVIGPNGIGKTTLLSIIVGALQPDAGAVRFGANVDIGYYDQKQSGLTEEKTAMEEIWDAFPRMEPDQVRGGLALFLLTGDDVFRTIGTYSGGERGRVALLKLMLKRDNFLILDEPTNHLDMDSREVLEHALDDYTGTILAVSHDRYFINRVCDRVIEMNGDGSVEYLGSYDDYVLKKQKMADSAEEEQVTGRTRTEIDKEKRRLRQEREVERQRERQQKELEQAILLAEQAVRDIEARLSDPATYEDAQRAAALAREHREALSAVDRLYDEWTEV